MLHPRTITGLILLCITLWVTTGVLIAVDDRDGAATVAVLGAVETVIGLALRRQARRGAERVSSPAAAVYVYDKARVIREMDTCRFPDPSAAMESVWYDVYGKVAQEVLSGLD